MDRKKHPIASELARMIDERDSEHELACVTAYFQK
jgi:hypothetical protein